MGNKRISELPTGSTPTGPELIEAVQGGVNVKLTAQEIADLGGGGSVLSVTGDGVNNADPTNPVIDLTGDRTVTSSSSLADRSTKQSDNVHIIYANDSTPFNITVDLLNVRTQVTVINIGSATVTLIEGAGVTLPGTTIAIATGENAIIIYRVPATPEVYISTSGGGTWGSITGTLSDQTDLQSALDSKQDDITFGSGVLTALAVNTGSAGAIILFNGNAGTPSAIVLTNASGLPVGAITGLGTGIPTWLATPSWTNFLAAITGTTPFYTTAAGGTATASNTFTFNTANWLNFAGTFTTTANTQYLGNLSGTITQRATASDEFAAFKINNAFVATANFQKQIGLQINTSTSGVFSQSHWPLLVGTPTTGLFMTSTSIGSTNSAFNIVTSNTNMLVVGVGGTVEVGTSASEIGAGFTINNSGLFSGSGSSKGLLYLKSSIGAATPNASSNYYGLNSDASINSNWSNSANFFGASLRNTFSPSGSSSTYTVFDAKPTYNASGGTTTVKGYNYAPTKASMTGITEWSFYATSGNQFYTGKTVFDATITAGGTTGDRTIDKPSGTVNIAAAGTTVTVTNSYCTTSSIVTAICRTNDTTAYVKNVVPGAGSFVINLGAAATAEVSIGFIVYN